MNCLVSPSVTFGRVVVYSRTDCPLCDEARLLLTEYAAYLPPLEVVDIETDPILREQFFTTIPVIAISGSLSEQNADMLRTARLLGARMTLAKPFEMQELVAAVSQFTDAPALATVR